MADYLLFRGKSNRDHGDDYPEGSDNPALTGAPTCGSAWMGNRFAAMPVRFGGAPEGG
jgi:hypothetical protein